MSRERFKESDLLDGNQTLIPELDSSGRKVITIDGSEISNFDSFKHANDSETKLYYLLASIRYILGSKAAKDMFKLISKIIKDTLKVDEVVYKNISGLQIDHESTNLLTDLVHSKDYISYQDFIFNPRIWLFFFWDCDNSEDNQSFNLCDDYFKYGLTVKIPVEVRLFESASRIDEVEFFYNCLELPTHEILWSFGQECFSSLGNYDSSKGAFLQQEFDGTSNRELVGEQYYKFVGLVGIKSSVKLIFLKSTEIDEVHKKLLVRINNLNFSEDDIKRFKIKANLSDPWTKRYYSNKLTTESPYGLILDILNTFIGVMDQEFMEDIGITEENSVGFDINVVSLKDNHVF